MHNQLQLSSSVSSDILHGETNWFIAANVCSVINYCTNMMNSTILPINSIAKAIAQTCSNTAAFMHCIYMLKYCHKYFMKNKVQGQAPSTLFIIKHKLGNDLWNFVAV